ncbi:MAG TPA: L-rhamnose isomerase, partial [Clostridia bacterium]|nr:L-rhamnose isomerase [Clostridia bacterium]
NNLMLTYDLGHYHQTESIADKISSTLLYIDKILLHVSRGVRWDSDHVVLLKDEILTLMQEIKRCDAFERVFIGLDFFDASINRLCAWVIGSRAALKSILIALLEPSNILEVAENQGDYGTRLALGEEFKAMPWSAVWDMYCEQKNVPVGADWLREVKQYEADVLSKRV